LSLAQSAILGLGLVILANSRPYEGLVFAIPVALAMLVWLLGSKRSELWKALARVVTPMIIVLLLGGLATGWYYQRVTGSAFRMTYEVSGAQYGTAPYFLWQTPRPLPVYQHAAIGDYYRALLDRFNASRTLKGYLLSAGQRFKVCWQFYLGPLLTVPLLALPWIVHQRKFALPLLICGVTAAGIAVEAPTLPHYFSPATGALYILLVQGLRQLNLWRRRTGLGPAVVRAIPVLAVAMILLRVTAVIAHTRIEPVWPRGDLQRAAALRSLHHLPGEHLVLVRYSPQHNPHREWVWNDADIDAAKVVWARDMGESRNQELLQYFRTRRVWQIGIDDDSPKLESYEPAIAPN